MVDPRELTPGDRVRVSEAYGHNSPDDIEYVGCEGTVIVDPNFTLTWVAALLDRDKEEHGPDAWGYFTPDELDAI